MRWCINKLHLRPAFPMSWSDYKWDITVTASSATCKDVKYNDAKTPLDFSLYRKCSVLSANNWHTDCCSVYCILPSMACGVQRGACKTIHHLEVWFRKTFPPKLCCPSIIQIDSEYPGPHAKFAKSSSEKWEVLAPNSMGCLTTPAVQSRSSRAFSLCHVHLHQGREHSR